MRYQNTAGDRPAKYSEEWLEQKTVAMAGVGKLGIGLNMSAFGNPTMASHSDNLKNRADLRRAMNVVGEKARELSKDAMHDKAKGAEYANLVDVMDGLATTISDISNHLDLQAAGDAAFGKHNGRGGEPVLDKEGRRIGTHLSNSVLRDEAQIARALNAEGGSEHEGVTLTDFFRGVAKMRSGEGVRNALSVGTDSTGGYTVPTILLPGVLNALVPASSMLNAGAHITVLTDGAKSFNIAGISSIPTPAWRSESGAVATSDPAFNSISITPRSLAFQFKVSRELLQDSPDIDQALQTVVAQAFAKEIDRAGLRGSGTAPEIKGLLNISGVNAISSGTNGATPTNYSGLISAWKSIATANAPLPTAAIMHPRDMATFAGLVDTTNQPLQRPELLKDIRFLQTSQIPTNLAVGTSGTVCSEIYVGEFGQFVFFMREGVSIQLATELYAGTGEVGFFCHTRLDVAAIYPQAFGIITGVKP